MNLNNNKAENKAALEKEEADKGRLGKAAMSWANAGMLGMHMLSGPLLGAFLGDYLDGKLNSRPIGFFCGLGLGLVAGGLNVYRDIRRLLRAMDAEDAADKASRRERGGAAEGRSGKKPANAPGYKDDDDDDDP